MEQHAEHAWTLLQPMNLPFLTPHEALLVQYTWVTMGLVILGFGIVSLTMKKIPGPFQNFVESIVEFLENYTVDIMGSRGLAYFPLILTVFVFILVGNYIGLVPGFIAPTSSLSTTAAFALVVFFFYQFVGFQKNGIKYLKHFMGPIPAMAPIMFIMEIISEIARPFSLALRLFANIMGGELITKLLFGIFAFGLPVIWMVWESIITAPIQSLVFSLMTMIYLAGVLASEEH
jgi:F-type H+-transporting ATPase subunit a